MEVTYRSFDIGKDDRERLFRLFASTYGDAEPLERRWVWQYVQHPRSGEIRIMIAEHGKRLVASTTRMPSDVVLGGSRVSCSFGCDSMVAPEYRRLGIMSQLYKNCSGLTELAFGKGTNPGMFELKLRLGYQLMKPDTYMIKVLSPVRWLLGKAGWSLASGSLELYSPSPASGFQRVHSFGKEFDEFFAQVAPRYAGIVAKDSEFMTWRYCKHPYKQYHAIYKRVAGEIVSMIVFRVSRQTVFIVDLIWDPACRNEPIATVRELSRYLKRCGYVKVYWWGTLQQLRKRLKWLGFIDLEQTLNVNFTGPPRLVDRITTTSGFHLVDGDSDNEWL